MESPMAHISRGSSPQMASLSSYSFNPDGGGGTARGVAFGVGLAAVVGDGALGVAVAATGLGPSGRFVICAEPDGTATRGCEGPDDVAHAATATPRITASATREPIILAGLPDVLLRRARPPCVSRAREACIGDCRKANNLAVTQRAIPHRAASRPGRAGRHCAARLER